MDFNQSATLPFLTLGSNSIDFDYAAYLRDEDLGYLGDSGSSTSDMNKFASNSVSPPTSAIAGNNSNQRGKLERRGHTKSRRGCYNCKRRRIKVASTRREPYEGFAEASPTVSRNSTVVRALL